MPFGWVSAGAAVVGAAGSILGSNQQSSNAQAATANQWDMFQQIAGNMQPYMQSGTNSLSQLNNYLNSNERGGPGGQPGLLHAFGAADLNANLAPNYQFQLGQGMGQIGNQNAAAGGAGGGNSFVGEQAYAQNYAGTAYQNAYNNYQNNQNAIYGRLGNLAQLGQASGTNSALGGSAFGQGMAATQVGAGNAQAAGYVGAANALSGGLGNIGSYYLSGNGTNSYNAQAENNVNTYIPDSQIAPPSNYTTLSNLGPIS